MKIRALNIIWLVSLAFAFLILPAHAHHSEGPNLFLFKAVDSSQLDEAWVNRHFTPGYYRTIVLQWGDFQYQDIDHQSAKTVFPVDRSVKAQLRADASSEFNRQMKDLRDYELIDCKDATPQTLIVRMNIVDIASYVPTANTDSNVNYLPVLWRMTLKVSLIDAYTNTLLFQGVVSEELKANGVHLKHVNAASLAKRNKRQVKRWAKALGKGIDKMKR